MSSTVAARSLQMHGIPHAPSASFGFLDVVARFVRNLSHTHPSPTEGKHLRLKWQTIETSLFVQCCQNLFLRTNDNPVPSTQAKPDRNR
jgi:hypothetical protein